MSQTEKLGLLYILALTVTLVWIEPEEVPLWVVVSLFLVGMVLFLSGGEKKK